jgi:ABC-2 type transport system ATP-binding protein
MDRAIGTYSKGMRQRVKVAGALVHDPQVLLLDEPFNGMDPRQRIAMMDLLAELATSGRTILFSSHILEEVEQVGTEILVLVAGRLAASGDFRAIRALMTDRPHTVTIRSSDDRRLAVALMADPAVFAVELTETGLAVQTSQLGFPAVDRRRQPDCRRASVGSRAGRRVAGERLRLPGAAMRGVGR